MPKTPTQPAALMNSPYYCDDVDGDWSGNLLNWATTTRADLVRKALYGGKRVLDTAAATVLERAHLPGDAHSFARYLPGGAELASFVDRRRAEPLHRAESALVAQAPPWLPGGARTAPRSPARQLHEASPRRACDR